MSYIEIKITKLNDNNKTKELYIPVTEISDELMEYLIENNGKFLINMNISILNLFITYSKQNNDENKHEDIKHTLIFILNK